jgi:UDP-N-acetylglucosamine--N-acetylmuramyl-(pentapeptide) pyrophosphoryl-undecaprenol N-acetylglucosamine transferase
MEQLARVIFAGGGTGGHFFPALSMARALQSRRACRILFVGTQQGIESKKAPQAGFSVRFLPVAGFQRYLTWKNLLFPFRLLHSMYLGRRILKEFQPHLVIGSGGYVMGPVLKSAQQLGINTLIQEQNSFPGVTTRLLARKAKAVFTAYEESAQFLPDAQKIILAGNPVLLRNSGKSKPEIYRQFGLNPELKTIFIFGGSQGAASINRAVAKLADGIPAGWQALWQTGEREFEPYRRLAKENDRLQIFPFIDWMTDAYSISSAAICRAGAMTLSELMLAGLPAVLIPLASAAADHQYKNARALADKGAAIVIRDGGSMPDQLTQCIRDITENRIDLSGMALRMKRLGKPRALDEIVDEIEKWLPQENNLES